MMNVNMMAYIHIWDIIYHHHVKLSAAEHVMTDKHSSNHHMDDEKFFKKIKGMNLYPAKRANKASKFDEWKQNNASYPNNTLNTQPSINSQKVNADGKGYNNKQRR